MREQLLAAEKVTAIAWREGALHLLDQRLLPFTQTWLAYDSAAAVAEAIRLMVVRGAPAIGIGACLLLAYRASVGDSREQLLQDALDGGGTDNITIIVGRASPKEVAG